MVNGRIEGQKPKSLNSMCGQLQLKQKNFMSGCTDMKIQMKAQ